MNNSEIPKKLVTGSYIKLAELKDRKQDGWIAADARIPAAEQDRLNWQANWNC